MILKRFFGLFMFYANTYFLDNWTNDYYQANLNQFIRLFRKNLLLLICPQLILINVIQFNPNFLPLSITNYLTLTLYYLSFPFIYFYTIRLITKPFDLNLDQRFVLVAVPLFFNAIANTLLLSRYFHHKRFLTPEITQNQLDSFSAIGFYILQCLAIGLAGLIIIFLVEFIIWVTVKGSPKPRPLSPRKPDFRLTHKSKADKELSKLLE